MKAFPSFLPTALVFVLSLASLVHAEDLPKPGDSNANISELKQIAASLPHDILVGLINNATKEAAATKATDVLHQKVEGRVATLKVKIDKIEKDLRAQQGQDAYRIKADDAQVREGAANFKTYLWIHFNVSENAKMSAMKKGAELKVTGKITLASVSAQNTLELHVDLSEATVN